MPRCTKLLMLRKEGEGDEGREQGQGLRGGALVVDESCRIRLLRDLATRLCGPYLPVGLTRG